MGAKEYELPNGRKAIFEFDENGVGKITLEAMDMLMELINIDLVRCGECKHYGFKETDRGGFPCCTNEIGVTPYRMPTDFCSYGERRADDTDNK